MSEEMFQAPDPGYLGELLPAYEFHAFIAQGGMGAVYHARQKSLDRDVAIKVLPRELGEDPEFRASFETEAKAMARLNHPNLIGVYDFGNVEGMPYIVMEYVDGKSLFHSSWDQIVDPRQAVDIVRGICLGLAHAHEQGVIHRDIKPANILLTPKAEPKIGDFGLALSADGDSPGIAMGTPGYTAPEIYQNAPADHRSDLFSLGVILHELVTGERPDGTTLIPQASSGDSNLDVIWRKATHPDPNLRYQSAAAMAAALERWSPSSAPNPAGPSAIPARGASAGRAERRKAGGKGPVIAALGAAVVLGVGIVVMMNREKSGSAAVAGDDLPRDPEAGISAPAPAEEEKARPEDADGTGTAGVDFDAEEADPDVEAMAAFESLREQLAAGSRPEFPPGTLRVGSSSFFLVREPMTWHQASGYAEASGGHLALPDSPELMERLGGMVPDASRAWLGGGFDGSRWVGVDGAPWKAGEPSGGGVFAAVDPSHRVVAGDPAEKLPFFIQWRDDGSNPGSLDARLEAVSRSLAGDDPLHPPGAVEHGGRHYALILRDSDLAGALETASRAGGRLASLSSAGRLDGLVAKFSGVAAPGGLWLGARRVEGEWHWEDGTPVGRSFPEDGDGLVLVPGKGIEPAPQSAVASGLIVEWADGEEAVAGAGDGDSPAEHVPPAESLELRARAVELIGRANDERGKRLEPVVRSFRWDYERWAKALRADDQKRFEPLLDKVNDLLDHNRIPVAGEGMDGPLEELAGICAAAAIKQRQVDGEHLVRLERLRSAYAARLGTLASEGGLSPALARELEIAETLDTWLKGLGVEEAVPEPFVLSWDPVLGHWRWRGQQNVVFHGDGTVEVVGARNSKVTWRKNEGVERGYRVVWDNRWFDTLVLSADGNRLEGKNQNGNRITARRTH